MPSFNIVIQSAVATDIIGSGMQATTQQANADQFSKLFDEHSGKLRDKISEGGKDAAAHLDKALDKFKNVQDSLSHQSLSGQIGTAKGYEYSQSKLGEHFATTTAQSSVENQAFGAMGAISAMGKGQKAIHALASQSHTVAQGDTIGKSAEIGEASKQYGSYGKFKSVGARMGVDQSFANYQGLKDAGNVNNNGSYTQQGMEGMIANAAMQAGASAVFGQNVNNKTAVDDLIKKMKGEDVDLEKAGLQDDKGRNAMGGKLAAALGKAQGGDMFGIKGGTFMTNSGESINLGITQASDGTARVSKYSSGMSVDTGGENAAMVAEFEALPGKGEGSSKTMAKEFAEFKKNYQKGNAIKQGWFGGLASSISEVTGVDEETVNNGMMIATGASVVGVAGTVGKGFKSWKKDKSSSNDSVPNETRNPSNNHSTNSTNDEIKSHHNNSSSENIPNSSINENGSQNKFTSDGMGGMKPNPNYVEPKASLLERAKNAFSGNFDQGFTLDNLKSVGKAALPAVAIEAGALGMEYLARNIILHIFNLF